MNDPMRKIGLVAHITFKDCLRSRVLYGIPAMGLVLFGVNLIFTGLFSWDLGKVAVDIGLSTVSFSGLILIFFFSITMMANDMEKKTLYLILSRPISRTQYVLGKYAGLGVILVFSSLVLGLCGALSVWVATSSLGVPLAEGFSWFGFFLSIVLQTLSLLVLLCLSLLWVTIASHPFTALLLTLMTYFVGQNMENVKNIILSTRLMDPNALSIKAINLASWILPNLAVFNIKTTIAHGLPVDPSFTGLTCLYGLSYIGICLCLSIWIFRKKEI